MRGRVFFAFITASLLASPTRADEKSFDSNGVKISYLDQGKGEVVVLLHGFGGSASVMWESMLPVLVKEYLVKEYRIIAPDFRGHGKSDKPHDSEKFGEEMAEDVIRLLDHLKIKKAHIVGYSFGCGVAGTVLVRHPDRLLSVTFGGGGPQFGQPPKAFAEALDATAESLEQGKGVGPLLIALAPEGQPKPSPEQAAAISKLVLGDNDQKALAAVLRSHKGLEVTEDQLRNNKVPVLFVYGSRDTQKELAMRSQKILPGAKEVVVDKGDHMSTAGSPEFRTAVLEFLHKHPK